MSNGNLGNMFDSLGEYHKAKEYEKKALAKEGVTGASELLITSDTRERERQTTNDQVNHKRVFLQCCYKIDTITNNNNKKIQNSW